MQNFCAVCHASKVDPRSLEGGDALVTPAFVLACGHSDNNTIIWTAEDQMLSPDSLPGYANLVRPILNSMREIAGTAANEGSLGSAPSGNVQGFRWTPVGGTIALDLLPGFTQWHC